MKWILGILMIFLVACSSAPDTSEPSAEQTTAPDTTESTTAPTESMSKVEAMGIAAAVQLGQPVKCTSTQDGQTSIIYMKGSQMRMDTTPADAHAIYTSDTMYAWQGKQGTMIKLSDMKKFAESSSQNYPAPSTQEDVVAKAEQYNAQCEVTSVSESMFSPPSDVEFQDLGDMMKQLEAYTGSIPQQ